MKNTQPKKNPIKTRKELGTLGCKDYTHNLKPQEARMTNKVLRKKSNCIVCRNAKSRFLKRINKKKLSDQISYHFVLF